MEENKILEKIRKMIEEARFGVTIKDISETLKISRITAARYVSYLLGKGEIEEKKYGRARVFFKK